MKRIASPKSTGGGGYVYENDVTSWLLACMLVEEPFCDAEYGVPIELDFQTSVDDLYFDDVLVTTEIGVTQYKFALSIKSNNVFSRKSMRLEFVTNLWKQWLQNDSSSFGANCDFVGLVSIPPSNTLSKAVGELCKKLYANDPEKLPSRLNEPGWATEDERKLFASFSCPKELDQTKTSVDTARLLQRVKFFHRDFGAVDSIWDNIALRLCRFAVVGKEIKEAQNLWSVLQEISKNLRPNSGSLTYSNLIERLNKRVSLANHPNHDEDWQKLNEHTALNAKYVRDKIAGNIHLDREEQVKEITELLRTNEAVTLLGPSGAGKSAIAKNLYKRRNENDDITVWVDATVLENVNNFEDFQKSLNLQHTLKKLFGKVKRREPLIIIDGLDRLYSKNGFRIVTKILQVAKSDEKAISWCVLVPCQSQEWSRVQEALYREGSPDIRWSEIYSKTLHQSDIEVVIKELPALARLILQPFTDAFLKNLMLLDLVARRLEEENEIDASKWVDESSVAEWFWELWIVGKEDWVKRRSLVCQLAEKQAEQLTATVHIENIDSNLHDMVEELTKDKIIKKSNVDHLTFAHDLYGDWVRFNILLSHLDNLEIFLGSRQKSPLWHRAIRMLGIHLLGGENGTEKWREKIVNCEALIDAQYLLIESPAFAMNAENLLDRIMPDLVSKDGAMLQRLLPRFMVFATVPDKKAIEFACSHGVDLDIAHATYRLPTGSYWLDILKVLHDHRDDVLKVAASETAELVEMWLERTPANFIRRQEASELGLLLGQMAHNSVSVETIHKNVEQRKRFYKCALLSAKERPDDVAKFAMIAACRVPWSEVEEESTYSQSKSRSNFGSMVLRGPWPDGPLDRVDEAFRGAVLDGKSIRYLFRENFAIAREVILAVLIESPYPAQRCRGAVYGSRLDLVHDDVWNKGQLIQETILQCLNEEFTEGLEIIMRLVEFATERSNEYATRMEKESYEMAVAIGLRKERVREIPEVSSQRTLLLHDGAKEHEFIGDVGSFGWSVDCEIPSGYLGIPPTILTSALKGLRSYFLQCIDKGQDVTERVETTFTRTRSIAPLSVLCDVGKKQVDLFKGPLRGLLSAPEIYSWDIHKQVLKGSVELANTFPHDLRIVASTLLLKNEDMQNFFTKVLEWWSKRRAGGERLLEIADQLELSLNPDNWEEQYDPAHGIMFINDKVIQMQSSMAEEIQENDQQILIRAFPTLCRNILDERKKLTDVQLEEMWQAWGGIRKQFIEKHSSLNCNNKLDVFYVDSITGGIAVFLWHEDWLSHRREHRYLIESTLATVADCLPDGVTTENEDSILTNTWECFLADTAAIQWAREPGNERCRHLVVEKVFSWKFAVVRVLFSRCAEYREALGDDFEQLRRVVIDWAHIRGHINVFKFWQLESQEITKRSHRRFIEEVEEWRGRVIDLFVKGRVKPLSDYDMVDDKPICSPAIEAIRKMWPEYGCINFNVIQCSHEWLPLPDEAISEKERNDIIGFWRTAMKIILGRAHEGIRSREYIVPETDDVWVITNLAAIVLQLRPEENPDRFWKPMIELPYDARYWSQRFLNEFHLWALSFEHTPATYGQLVREFVKCAFSMKEEVGNRAIGTINWDALLGIDLVTLDEWEERHVGYVESIQDVISMWMKNVPLEEGHLFTFARWLSTPAAMSFRMCALAWILERIKVSDRRNLEFYKGAIDDLAKLLYVIKEQNWDHLMSNAELFAAFQGILTWLVESQNTLALELQRKISSLE